MIEILPTQDLFKLINYLQMIFIKQQNDAIDDATDESSLVRSNQDNDINNHNITT